jgi:hypothetical protein
MAEATDDNSNLVDMDDLKAFEDKFYGIEPEDFKEEEEPTFREDELEEDEVDENEDDSLAPDDDEQDEPEDKDEEEEEPEPEPEDKGKKKSRYQSRIDELVTDARVAEREVERLRREVEALKSGRVEKVQEPEVKQTEAAPNPNAVNEKGEPIYALGEFDPKFVADLTRFTIAQEHRAIREAEAKEQAARKAAEAQRELSSKWNEKVEKFVEEIPDYSEKVVKLERAFQGIEPQYGNYLAGTIMQCDNGPEIMYYLSQNIDEAQKIVASGAFDATLAIGRLSARLEKPKQEEKRNTKKVSKAPEPPEAEARVRGSGGQFTVSPDTSDLDAFEREFFKKPKTRFR